MKKIFAMSISLFIIFGMYSMISAQQFKNQNRLITSDSQKTATKAQAGIENSQTKNSGAIKKCETVESRIQNRITTMSRIRTRHINAYDGIIEKITSLIDEFKEEGKNTTNLQIHLDSFENKVAEFSEDYESFYSNMQQTENYACGSGENTFRNQLRETRSLMKNLSDSALAIQNLYRNTIRAEIVDLQDAEEITT
ncbi:hypothetical protein ACFL14_00965 [Patescibacteria group bacterium]